MDVAVTLHSIFLGQKGQIMVKGNVTALLVIGFVTGMLVSRFIGSYTRHKDVRDAIFRAEQA